MHRVLFLNPSLYAIGGMQAWLAGLMPDLKGKGWEVGLALPSGAHNDPSEYLARYPFEPLVLIENPTGSRLGRLQAIDRGLDAFRPDVLVVANIVSAYRAIERRRAMGLATPRVVACVHTLDPGIFQDLNRFAGVLDGLIAPNRLIAAAAVELAGMDPARVHYAPYRVETPAEPPAEASPTDRLELVFAHRIDQEQKRAFDLVPLVAALRDRGLNFRLSIIGFGEGEQQLRAQLAAELEAGCVRWVGPVPPSELRERVLGPDRILLVLSEWEMGPIVAWQAMAWGSPVVCSRYVGSGREGFLRDGRNALLFDVGDMSAAARSIERLAAEPALRRELALRAWSDASRRFSREAATGAWDVALRSILSAPPLPPPPLPPPIPPAGRLDRVLGVTAAERVRRALRWPVRAAGPGDEWPHTEGGGLSREDLMETLARLDRSFGPGSELSAREQGTGR